MYSGTIHFESVVDLKFLRSALFDFPSHGCLLSLSRMYLYDYIKSNHNPIQVLFPLAVVGRLMLYVGSAFHSHTVW